jgi:hypothetical protein
MGRSRSLPPSPQTSSLYLKLRAAHPVSHRKHPVLNARFCKIAFRLHTADSD